jgi:pimeloyl-ACP methyl ester carboxylesterase
MITVNGHNLHLETSGPEKGEPIILLHHGLGSVRSWDAQVPALAEAGYRVIAYDRWGYGESVARKQLSMPHFKEDLSDLQALIELLAAQPTALLGHSDGGTIALYFAARRPEWVTALVTVAAHIYIEDKMTPGIESVRKAYEQDSRLREGLRRRHGDKVEHVFWGWYKGWTQQEKLTWDMRPLLPKITSPTLVVQGEMDEHATPQHALDIANAIPNAELWVVPGEKHMFPQEEAETFNKRLIRFLERTVERMA